jgi:hypothetical protein
MGRWGFGGNPHEKKKGEKSLQSPSKLFVAPSYINVEYCCDEILVLAVTGGTR